MPFFYPGYGTLISWGKLHVINSFCFLSPRVNTYLTSPVFPKTRKILFHKQLAKKFCCFCSCHFFIISFMASVYRSYSPSSFIHTSQYSQVRQQCRHCFLLDLNIQYINLVTILIILLIRFWKWHPCNNTILRIILRFFQAIPAMSNWIS